MRVGVADVVAKTLVLVPSALLAAVALDVGGLQAPVSQVVVTSAEAVARPVADELLERLPWPGPRAADRSSCVFGPYPADHRCAAAPAQAPT